MKKDTKLTGTIRSMFRLPSSRQGNPRYVLAIEDMEGNIRQYETKANAGIAYAVGVNITMTFNINSSGKVY